MKIIDLTGYSIYRNNGEISGVIEGITSTGDYLARLVDGFMCIYTSTGMRGIRLQAPDEKMGLSAEDDDESEDDDDPEEEERAKRGAEALGLPVLDQYIFAQAVLDSGGGTIHDIAGASDYPYLMVSRRSTKLWRKCNEFIGRARDDGPRKGKREYYYFVKTPVALKRWLHKNT